MNVPSLIVASEPVITWIKVEKPKLDLVGLILGSFALTGLLIVTALALGVLFGATLIYRRRDQEPALTAQLDIQSR
jgi:hypothetical protein